MNEMEPKEWQDLKPHEQWLRSQSGDMTLTVESLINTLQDALADRKVSPDSRVLVHVQDSQGFTGAECLVNQVTWLGFGKYAVLTPARSLVLEPPREVEFNSLETAGKRNPELGDAVSISEVGNDAST